MNVITEARPLGRMKPMGQGASQTQEGKPEKAGMPPKQDSYSISPQGRATVSDVADMAETTETKPVANTGITSTVVVGNGSSVASTFSDPADYLNYLKDTYPSITNSNITMSEKVLMQAMTDPEKEKVLTDFLTEMDGAADYRASQVAGLNDGTYNYEMTHYSIHLDSIAHDNSGVIGGDFTVITVAREDGQKMGKMEFGEVKEGVIEYFHDIHQEQMQQHNDMWSEFISKQLELKEKQLEKMEAQRLEEKQAQRKEERKPSVEQAPVSPKEKAPAPDSLGYGDMREKLQSTPVDSLPNKGGRISAQG